MPNNNSITQAQKNTLATQATFIGLISSLVLAVFKTIAGLIGHSQALIADAVESFADLITTIVVLISLKVSGQPVDYDHPYGHGRVESIAAAFTGLVVILAGLAIIWQTVQTVLSTNFTRPSAVALAAVVITIITKEILYRYLKTVAGKTNSTLLKATAVDHRKDAITSVATLIGVAGAIIGWPGLDPLAAAVVAAIIFKLGYDILKTSLNELMDKVPEEPSVEQLIKICESCAGVEHAYARARRLGSAIFVDVKIDIDPKITVKQGHDIADSVKKCVMQNVENIVDVMVHVNPHLHEE